jgi:DNA-3-methyladenine glycosylase
MECKTQQLQVDFFRRKDTVLIARELLGKVLYTSFENEITAGFIIETEAYVGINDKASHAYNNRRTKRTEVMYNEGGCAYVYLCYGIHSLFNIVTSVQDDPQAVLVRSISPLYGIDVMKGRLNKEFLLPKNGIGPGNITKLLGINLVHTGISLCREVNNHRVIWIEDVGREVPEEQILASRRIGVEYAGEDAKLLYRFQWIEKNKAPF